jgi:sulfite reductase alpha subunit-like flavoprotein
MKLYVVTGTDRHDEADNLVMPNLQPVTRVYVLYATATGTAEDVAHDVAQRFALCGVPVESCTAVDSYAFEDMPTDAARGALFVFVVATAGDGEAPACMSRFWTVLRSAGLPGDALAAVRFAVFGLGDRAYAKFNAAARRLATRMEDLGATLITPLALGDESSPGGYDAALRPWLEALFLVAVAGYSGIALPSPLPPPDPRWRVELEQGELWNESQNGSLSNVDYGKWCAGQVPRRRRLSSAACASVVEATVVVNHVLTNPDQLRDDREVRHIELDLSSPASSMQASDFSAYLPGDVVNVMPRNRASAVDAFLRLTGYDGQDVVTLTAPASCRHASQASVDALNIKTPCRLADFVAAQLDLSAIPRRRFLERLAAYATDDMQRAKLIEFTSPDGSENLVQYAFREKRTILIALRDFPSARPPLEQLVDMIPSLRPRPFSIASSRAAHGSRIHICAAIVRYTSPLRFARVGVCSSLWLHCVVGDVVPIYLERGTLRFDEFRPAILVGPGTGIAPMRSFISSLPVGGAGHSSGRTRILYFGCRQSRGDYLYEAEWSDAVECRRILRVETAFSREESSSKAAKVYVQDLMKRDAAEVWRLVNDGASIYVAGMAGDMPKAVRLVIAEAAVTHGGMSEFDANRFVKRLEASRRLQVESW